jgi:SPP1 family predicted phage head-tail adaptor
MTVSTKRQAFIEAGKLNRRITIQQLVRVSMPSGGYRPTWTNVPGCESVPAESRPWKGWEQMASGQLTPTGQERFRIRYRAGLTAEMQVIYRGRTFNIRNIANIEEANVILELLCEERRAGAPGGAQS